MKSFSLQWSADNGWQTPPGKHASRETQLILAFGPVEAPPQEWFAEARVTWPSAQLIYCTAGGQINGVEVHDASVVLTGMEFDNTGVTIAVKEGAGVVPCEPLGTELGLELAAIPALKHVLVLVDGLYVNGAAFTRGLSAALPEGVTVSGGLASDGLNFLTTGLGVNGLPSERRVVAIGLSGESVRVGTGSAGGWVPFGPERTVTRSVGATVYELDGQPALAIYKRYLGELALELPGSALLFPLAVSAGPDNPTVVRTILGIDDPSESLRFAGDVPEGSKVRLMRSTNDEVLDGAAVAANLAVQGLGGVLPSVMICISCIGRRAVLKSRVEEELEEVGTESGDAIISGYYSNGEISPSIGGGVALLHNQTMTVTAIGEV